MFLDLGYFFMLQSILHQVIIVALEFFYAKLDRTLSKAQVNSTYAYHISQERDSIRSILENICFMDPDMVFPIGSTYSGYILFSTIILYFWFIKDGKHILDLRNSFLFKYLQNRDLGDKMISMELDRLIDDIIYSNSIHDKILKTSLMFDVNKQISLLKEERAHLYRLKHEKISIWPSNRSQEWMKKLKRLSIILAICIYIFVCEAGTMINVAILHISNSYRKSKLDSYTRGWLSFKSLLDSTLYPLVSADRATYYFILLFMVGIDHLKLVCDNMESMDSMLLTIRGIGNIEETRGHSFTGCDSESVDSERYNTRVLCSKLSMEAYIKFRYSLRSLDRFSKNLLHDIGCLVFLVLLLSVVVALFYPYFKTDREKPFFISLVCTCYLIFNLGMLTCALFNCYCRNEFMKCRSVCASYTVTPVNDTRIGDKKTLFDQIMVSSHCHLLWTKIIEPEFHITRRYSAKLGLGLTFDYDHIIKANLASLYVMMFLISYNDH